MTHLKEIIDTVHRKVHEGKVFSVGCDQTSLANDAYVQLLIRTGANALHAIFTVSCSGEVYAEFFENATYSNAGTALVSSNHNRSSINTTTATFTHEPTVTNTGTRFDGKRLVPGGSGPFAGGATGANWEQEIVLKANTTYLAKITNVSGQARRVEVHTMFYEPALPLQ
jgi:hypothetical protein